MAKPPLSRPRPKPAAQAVAAQTLHQLEARTAQSPQDPEGWKALGQHLLKAGDSHGARTAAERAVALAADDAGAWLLLAQVEAGANRAPVAHRHFEHVLSLAPDSADALYGLGSLLAGQERNREAVVTLDKLLEQNPAHTGGLLLKVRCLTKLSEFAQATELCKTLIRIDPRNAAVYWIDLGHINRELSQFGEAESCYRQAARLAPAHRAAALSNLLTLLHYVPDRSAEDILAVCREWGTSFTARQAIQRAQAADRTPTRVIRIGMFSDGFRQHPVGAMTLSALEHVSQFGIEIYAYTTSEIVDALTQRMMKLARKWTRIGRMTDPQFAQQLRDDGIDILVDLAGHNAGTRMSAVALEPAPIIIKWVGGLINTTGVQAIDYLITDSVESPPGTDALYTEKLIRMPDDYICYVPPASVPNVGPLPALENGYVTFGCFNNPTKLNDVLLAQWAQLMHAVPDSRLYLKSGPLSDPLRQAHIRTLMASHGIAAERLLFEGRSMHYQLFECYNKVDIALDPWPYSGGLTTCEAMLMGVPVISLPGPTFAGRHSATHLSNVGMPEMVVSSWEEYRARAVELASNLEVLGTIRAHLRQVLLESPVCNSTKFARHLADALRAVWQRYCEGKPRAALAFTPEGQPWFEDDAGPTIVQHPEVSDNAFGFSFKGKIVTLEHGGVLTQSHKFVSLSQLRTLSTVSIDPAGSVTNADRLKAAGHLEHYQTHLALGDGEPATLYACLDAALSGTLEPLPAERQISVVRQGASVLARLPISTLPLDGIDGLERVDWLLLDDRHDNIKILQGARRLLDTALVVQVRILFPAVFEAQPDLARVTAALGAHGLRLLRLDQAEYRSHFPADLPLEKAHGGSQLFNADAIFIPDDARLAAMDDNRRLKLAFLLHGAYGAQDLAYRLVGMVDEQAAKNYLVDDGWIARERDENDAQRGAAAPAPRLLRRYTKLPATPGRKRYIHVCFNNMNVQHLISLLADETLAEDFTHSILIERSRSMPGYDNDVSANPNAFFFDASLDLPAIVDEALTADTVAVIFHGLFFDWQKKLVKDIGTRQKTVWVIWGGDLYNPLKAGRPMTDVVSCLDMVCPLTAGDYDLFLANYPAKPRSTFGYAGMGDLAGIPVPEQKSKQIFVGNSGDSSNCHIEVLDALATMQDIGEYRIVLPVSYSLSPEYEKRLVRHVAELGLEGNVQYLKRIMPPHEYYSLLAQSEFAITAHQRQQGLGNIIASLYFGVKTILRDVIEVNGKSMPNPSWRRVTEEYSAQPIAFSHFCKQRRLQDLAFTEPDALAILREKILAAFDAPTVKRAMKVHFQNMAQS